MKKSALFAAVLVVFGCSTAFAATTVTVDDDNSGSMTVVQTSPQAVVVQPQPIIITESRDPRELEGVITRVDYPGSQITVQDIDGREKRVELKQGMITTYKVDDYVKIYLMADMREAKTIETRQTADVEGDIVGIDYANNRVIVRESTGDRTVIFTPGTIKGYKTGDHVRLYVVSNYTNLQEAKIIRVK